MSSSYARVAIDSATPVDDGGSSGGSHYMDNLPEPAYGGYGPMFHVEAAAGMGGGAAMNPGNIPMQRGANPFEKLDRADSAVVVLNCSGAVLRSLLMRAAFMCGREPNFELTVEEKDELNKLSWDDFLTLTRSAINSKSNLNCS
ncbi:hypothetical protein L1987_13390 [Smallanthus sonchifolius]|uniref:Uncharacterized protein n=1 Tax=Smallanthus sonchifolius TaxID=185202 RepID=A0ACB9JGE1_9ASTR|nr:hypothetical protein L1987_13390 [Smallanthus sonchifolius]